MGWYKNWREKRKRKKEEQKEKEAEEQKKKEEECKKREKEYNEECRRRRINTLKEEYETARVTYNELVAITNRITSGGEHYIDNRLIAARNMARAKLELENLGIEFETVKEEESKK